MDKKPILLIQATHFPDEKFLWKLLYLVKLHARGIWFGSGGGSAMGFGGSGVFVRDSLPGISNFFAPLPLSLLLALVELLAISSISALVCSSSSKYRSSNCSTNSKPHNTSDCYTFALGRRLIISFNCARSFFIFFKRSSTASRTLLLFFAFALTKQKWKCSFIRKQI